MNDFPTALAARQCVTGEFYGCGKSAAWTLTRAASILAGMYLAGEREKLIQKSLAGSLAVETFVVAWSATHLQEPVATLPSVAAVQSRELPAIAFTYLARSAMVYAGLNVFGFKKHSIRNALAGTAMIEASVLLWSLRNPA